MSYTLKIKSAEKNCFKVYNYILTQNIKCNVFSIKQTKNSYSVIRSPHANKNSQEQFNLLYYKHIIKIKTENARFKTLKNSLIQNQNISGSIHEKKKNQIF